MMDLGFFGPLVFVAIIFVTTYLYGKWQSIKLQQLAKDKQWGYEEFMGPRTIEFYRDIDDLPLFNHGSTLSVDNVLTMDYMGKKLKFFYLGIGAGKSRQTMAVAAFTNEDWQVPYFRILPKSYVFIPSRQIRGMEKKFVLDNAPHFSKKYTTWCILPDRTAAFFTPTFIDRLVSQGRLYVEGHGNTILIYKKQALYGPEGTQDLIDRAKRILDAIASAYVEDEAL
ncbi:MAG: hypothetical protein ACPGJS_00400 [Flammeovirgaceae bacterium]